MRNRQLLERVVRLQKSFVEKSETSLETMHLSVRQLIWKVLLDDERNVCGTIDRSSRVGTTVNGSTTATRIKQKRGQLKKLESKRNMAQQYRQYNFIILLIYIPK